MAVSALLRRLAFAAHFKDGGRALLHLTDLQNLRKNPIFLRDLIPSDCAPALSKITLRGSGGSGRQPTFGGQHHLCLISFGVGFIFTFTGPTVKRYDHLDPLQWLRSCTARGKSERTKWFAHAMQFWMTRLKNLFSFFFNIKRMSQCLMGAWKRYWKVEIGKFGNNLTISFGNFDNFGDKLWTQNRALGTRSSSWSKVFLSFAPGCNSSLRFKSKSAGRWTFVKLLRDCHRLPLLLLPVGERLATGLKLYPLILTAGVVDFAFLQMSTSLQRMTKANAGKYKTLFFEKNFSLRELDKTSDNELLTVSFIGQ